MPSEPPSLSDVVGRVHSRFPLAALKVDDDDPRHFLARDNTRADEIANDVDHLLSARTSWPSLFFFIRDGCNFESIKGPASDFQVFLSGLSDIWANAADFDTRELARNMISAVRLIPKAEKEIDRLEAAATRYRNERKAARERVKTTEAELSRLRQAANDTLDSNARLLIEVDQLRATDANSAVKERDEARASLTEAIAHSKAAMSKQVSRYQQLSSIADKRNARIRELEAEAVEKDKYVLETEREHADVYREREAAERETHSLQKKLEEATALFEAAREARVNDHKDFDERALAYKKRIAELDSRLSALPAGEADLRALVVDANERAGIAEEEYRLKSAEFKAALKEIATLKVKIASRERSPPVANADKKANTTAPKTTQTKSLRWSFEPSYDMPASQPFWDHSNEFSRHIASMVTATVTALPNIPMQMAISTAIETVRAVGPSLFKSLDGKTLPKPVNKSSKPF